MSEGDLYATLGVSRTASPDEIKKAFRKLAKELHPDRNPGDKKAEAKFKRASRAHDVLSNPEKRAAYDEFGEPALSENFNVEAARRARDAHAHGGGGASFEDFFGGFQGGQAQGSPFGGGGFGGVFDFEEIFGGGGGRRQRGQGIDIEAVTTIDLLDALRGVERELHLQVPGSGEHRTIRVRIPAGVKHDDKLRLRGQGAVGRRGGKPGDLLLTIHVAPHPLVERRGDDLYLDVPVTPLEARRGAKVRVPTPSGEVDVRIPERSQSGMTLRLREKGARSRRGSVGDLYVRIMVRLPTTESADVDRALEALEREFTEPVRANLKL